MDEPPAGLDPWARRHLDRLAELESGWPAACAGPTLVHGDVRSDNVLLTRDGAVFVDWPHAAVGNPAFDVVRWAPSVVLEGGPPPEELLSRHAPSRARRPRRRHRPPGRRQRVLRVALAPAAAARAPHPPAVPGRAGRGGPGLAAPPHRAGERPARAAGRPRSFGACASDCRSPTSPPGESPGALFDEVVAGDRGRGAGYDSVWVMDHFYQLPPHGRPEPAHARLLHAARRAGGADRRRVRLGAMVTGVTYRNPAHLAKIVTTLDVISAGRAILGIGAAWYDVEHEGLGFDFPPAGERLDRLEEALQICRAMFTEEAPSFDGTLLPDPRSAQRARRRSSRAGRRSSSAAAARSGRCSWWPATPTCATSSATPRRSPTRSRSCAGTARRSGATRPRSRSAG